MTIAVPTTATTAAPAPSAAVAAATLGTFFTRPGLVHRQGATLKILLVKHRDGLGRILLGPHFDESKASGTTRCPVLHNIYRHDGTGLGEVILQIVFGCGEG